MSSKYGNAIKVEEVQKKSKYGNAVAADSEPLEPDYPGASVIEPAKTVGTAALAQIFGGLAGLFQSINPMAESGAGAKTVEKAQEFISQPKTKAGQEGLKTLGDLAQRGIDIVNFPISGLVGLAELIGGQGIDKAVESIRGVQEEGAGVTIGNRVFEETGSPMAATLAQIAPEALAEFAGLKGGGAAVKGAAGPTANTIRRIGEVFRTQSPTKQRIARLLEEGSTDIETARFQLEAPRQSPTSTIVPESSPVEPGNVPRGTSGDQLALPPPEAVKPLETAIQQGIPRVVRDPQAINAINKGFDEGVVAAIKGSSPADKAKMLEMVDIMERGKKNARFTMTNRPSDVAGNTLLERFNVVLDANRRSGQELDNVARNLKGVEFDSTAAAEGFLDDLDSMGIKLKKADDGKLEADFGGSDIEGLQGPEAAINQIVERMQVMDKFDAFEAHRLKRFIDEIVSYGSVGEGLRGRTQNILKNLRRNLDTQLDRQFGNYKEVNQVYSDTINAIDNLQDVAGRKMNLTGTNANAAVGTLLRRLMSNAQSRVNLLDAVEEIDAVARRNGGKFNDDLLTQVLFVDELDNVFGTPARTSFQGQISQAIPSSGRDLGKRIAEGVVDKTVDLIRGDQTEAQFKAIRELLQKEGMQ